MVRDAVADRLVLARDAARRRPAGPLRHRVVLSGWSAVADGRRGVLKALTCEQFRVIVLDVATA